MICVRCSRPLLRAAVSIRNGSTVHAYGPKCARVSGLIDKPQRAKVVRAQSKTSKWIDDMQLALLELTE